MNFEDFKFLVKQGGFLKEWGFLPFFKIQYVHYLSKIGLW